MCSSALKIIVNKFWCILWRDGEKQLDVCGSLNHDAAPGFLKESLLLLDWAVLLEFKIQVRKYPLQCLEVMSCLDWGLLFKECPSSR